MPAWWWPATSGFRPRNGQDADVGVEYRVRWRREGRRINTRIVQSWDTACDIKRRVEDVEHHRHDPEAMMDDGRRYSDYASMPPLEEWPVIEVRDVGEWRPNEHQPVFPAKAPAHSVPVGHRPFESGDIPF